MKRSLSMIAIGIVTCVVTPAFVAGCGDASVEREAHAGTATMALTGVSGTGKTYRLRGATFNISGTATKTASSDDDPSASSIMLELKAGGYLAKLATGWVLEVQAADGTFSAIPAVLTSTNPLPFTIVDQQTTQVLFQFKAGKDVVQLGDGRAQIGIAVTDCADGSCDQDGDGVTPPADCNDANGAIFPGAMEVCNGLDDNCDGQVDEGGVCGGGGGNCDASGACDTCSTCAQAGTCLDQTNACVADQGCLGFNDCLNNCGGTQACVDSCTPQFPASSVDLFNTLITCLTCTCQVSCQVPAGTCQ